MAGPLALASVKASHPKTSFHDQLYIKQYTVNPLGHDWSPSVKAGHPRASIHE